MSLAQDCLWPLAICCSQAVAVAFARRVNSAADAVAMAVDVAAADAVAADAVAAGLAATAVVAVAVELSFPAEIRSPAVVVAVVAQSKRQVAVVPTIRATRLTLRRMAAR